MSGRIHPVILAGPASAAMPLRAAGIADVAVVDRPVVRSRFDDDSDSWTLTTDDGENHCGRIVITCDSPLAPFLPDLIGRRDFRGCAMHASSPSSVFDPAGRRIAVVGADSNAGALIERVAASAASIRVFALPPRRQVTRERRLRRPVRRHRVEVVTTSIEEVTAVGVRTVDGVHHDADALIFGTGFEVRHELPAATLIGSRGLDIRDAWRAGAEPYLGLAIHGFPNYFLAGGPDRIGAIRQIVSCLQLMGGATRIEVRRSAAQVFNDRIHLRRPAPGIDPSAFDVSLTSAVDDDFYDGPAVLTGAGTQAAVRVTLAGRLEPFDGRYHWQGTIFGPVPDDVRQARQLTVTVRDRCADARITERTAQGTLSVVGTGVPPFARAIPLPT